MRERDSLMACPSSSSPHFWVSIVILLSSFHTLSRRNSSAVLYFEFSPSTRGNSRNVYKRSKRNRLPRKIKTEMRERRGASRSSMQMSLLSRYNDALIDAVLTFSIHFSSSPLTKGGTESAKLRSTFDERVCENERVNRRWTLNSGGKSTINTPLSTAFSM